MEHLFKDSGKFIETNCELVDRTGEIDDIEQLKNTDDNWRNGLENATTNGNKHFSSKRYYLQIFYLILFQLFD